MVLMNDVYRYIENNYQLNEPIFLSELNIPGMKAVSVRQQLKKLTESGRLKRFDTGIYYIPKKSMFRSGSTLSVDEVIRRKCLILILKECRKYALFRAYWQESVTIL